MKQPPNDQSLRREPPPEDAPGRERRDSIRRYILGELSEEGREQIERQVISRDDYFEELLIAEEELTDEYVGERLSGPARAQFQRRVRTDTELRQNVRFAKALRRRAAEHAQQRPAADRSPPLLARITSFFRQPALGFALTAALLLAVSAAVWMTVQNRRLRTEVARLSAEPTPLPVPQTGLQAQLDSERERGAQLAAQLGREQEQRAEAERKLEEATREQGRPRRDQSVNPLVAAVFTLKTGIVRGEGDGSNKITLPPGGGHLLLRLDLAADDYRSYRATLKTLEDKQLHSTPNLRARAGRDGNAVPFPLSAKHLAPNNDYKILLSGKSPNGSYEDVGTYYFRVEK